MDPAILRHLGMVFVPIVATFSAIAITSKPLSGLRKHIAFHSPKTLEHDGM
jgi:hypothetical protein